MAPIEKPNSDSSIRLQLKALHDSKEKIQEQLKSAAALAKVYFDKPLEDLGLESERASPARLEAILRWLLERLRSQEGNNQFLVEHASWRLLTLLVIRLSTARVARVLKANSMFTILLSALQQLIYKFPASALVIDHSSEESASSTKVTKEQKESRKRKRGHSRPQKLVEPKPELFALLEEISNFLFMLIRKSQQGTTDVKGSDVSLTNAQKLDMQNDFVASEHMNSVLRVKAYEAAQILGFWFRCLLAINEKDGFDLQAYERNLPMVSCLWPILQIWQRRSPETDDTLGSSADVFSAECLVPATKLYSQLTMRQKSITSTIREGGPIKGQRSQFKVESIISAIEELFARHLFLPARTAFASSKNSKSKAHSESALYKYLEPLMDEILLPTMASRSEPDNGPSPLDDQHQADIDNKGALIRVLPLLLEEAIKLSRSTTPKQRATDTPWIEHVFAALCYCAGEPIPYNIMDATLADGAMSAIPNMLQVVHEQGVSLSSEFLESILVDYSGLIGARERLRIRDLGPLGRTIDEDDKKKTRWPLITILLRLDGSLFLKKYDKGNTKHKRTNYVDALVAVIADGKWEPKRRFPVASSKDINTPTLIYPFDVAWQSSTKVVAEQIIIPLMKAFAGSRDLIGFMNLWFRQLRNVWRKLGTSEESSLVWTGTELQHAFWDLLQDTLTAKQTNEQIIEYVGPVQGLLDEHNASTSASPMKWEDFQASAPASAAFFMLNFILQGVDRLDILQQHLPTLTGLMSITSKYLALDLSRFSCAATVWSLFTRLQELSPRVDTQTTRQMQREALVSTGLIEQAIKTCYCAVYFDFLHPNHHTVYSAGLEAYRFVLVVSMDMLDLPDLKSKAEEYIRLASAQLIELIVEHGVEDVISRWINANAEPEPLGLSNIIETISIKARVLDAMILLVQFPQCFKIFQPAQRHSIFVTLLKYIADKKQSWDRAVQGAQKLIEPPTSFQTLLDGLKEHLLSLGSTSVMHDFVSVVATELLPVTGTQSGQAYSTRVALDTLLSISPAAITRQDREAILDKILSNLTIVPGLINNEMDDTINRTWHKEQRTKSIALAVRLLNQPNATARVCLDANILWEITSVYDQLDSELAVTKECLETLKSLFESVLRQAIVDPAVIRSQDDTTLARSRAFMEQFFSAADKSLVGEKSLSGRPALVILLSSFLSISASLNIISDDVRSIASFYFNALISTLEESRPGPTSTQQWIIWQAFAAFPHKKLGTKAPTPHLSDLSGLAEISSLNTMVFSSPLELVFGINTKLSAFVALLSATSPHMSPGQVLEITSRLLGQNLSARDYGLLLQAFEQYSRNLRPVHRAELFASTINTSDANSPSEFLQILQILLSSLTQEEAPLSDDFGTCLSKLCTKLQHSKNVAQFNSCIDCINITLRTKQWLVSQYGIDTLIAVLTTISSSRPGAFWVNKDHAGIIYSQICQTTTNILILHRKRIGGRFHLLVPLLQNLLSCLFTPHNHQGPRSASSLPPWLHNTSPLNVKHALAYSKVLSRLADPTGSSTAQKWHAKSTDLVDEIKKAKEYAGQYVPYILMRYCSLQLGGSIEGDVRDALKSGIWSLMDVVDMEGMRGLNAGLGRDERVIWKGLYDDWSKFGKGKRRS
ncbi:hypothetical protein EJ08DRAFT_21497 [Tothia fuscella]|uniref:Nucleolar 27S pre-rRNA processing Urb2/Npa2 C-terminal domain-containing protein n=1 Tax=Tothia fuscella TaxID=1048955 RepID=A0A9P4NZP4_9PEZI|nr:hypothetical protein EJ08DRAFT_21497 [Tothia fuscella]